MKQLTKRTILALSMLSIVAILIAWYVDISIDINFTNDPFIIKIRDTITMSAIWSIPFIGAILFWKYNSGWLRYTSFILNALFSIAGAFTAFQYLSGRAVVMLPSMLVLALLFPIAAILAVALLRAD
jgi:hypothetical protein